MVRKILDTISLWIKTFLYSTLTEENVQKIINRKEKELKEIKFLEEEEIENIRKQMYDELSDYLSDEEIDEEIAKTFQ